MTVSEPASPQLRALADTRSALIADRDSVLYSMLPALVQSRMPKIPSIRRSLSSYGRRPPSFWGNASSGTCTPPPCYSTGNACNTPVIQAGSGFVDDVEGLDLDRPRASSSVESTLFPASDAAGVRWKYARQGMALLTLSAQEAAHLAEASESDNRFCRRLYVNAVTYLLQGLPEDLSADESLSIQSALPEALADDTKRAVHRSSGALAVTEPGTRAASPITPCKPSVLHRILASTIIQVFLIAHFLLPYLQLLLAFLYRYDREHKVSERIFRSTVGLLDSLGKTGVEIGGLVYNKEMTRSMRGVAAWCLTEAAGGFCDGLDEGMAVVGIRGRSEDRKTS